MRQGALFGKATKDRRQDSGDSVPPLTSDRQGLRAAPATRLGRSLAPPLVFPGIVVSATDTDHYL